YFGEPFKVPGSDHFSIAKPKNNCAIQHRLLCQFIQDTLKETAVNNRQQESLGSQVIDLLIPDSHNLPQKGNLAIEPETVPSAAVPPSLGEREKTQPQTGTLMAENKSSLDNSTVSTDKPVKIEITIDRDFESYTEEDQENFLRAIRSFLQMSSSDLKIKNKVPGSVKITLEILPEIAEK